MVTTEVLSAMITPAVLISASGMIILSTTGRIARVVDRVRKLSELFEQLEDHLDERSMAKRERMSDQLNRLADRAHLLQQSLTSLYSAIGCFVLSSLAIGIVAITHTDYAWIPVSAGLLGACLLLYGSVLLVYEARLSVASTLREMNLLRSDMAASLLARRRTADTGQDRG